VYNPNAPELPPSVARGGGGKRGRSSLAAGSDVVSGSVFQRVLSSGISEHAARDCRVIRGPDAVVLRRCAGRRDIRTTKIDMKKRPNLLVGEDLPAGPLQKRSLEKRARLKAAAIVTFGKKGYEGTSIDEIADRAGLAIGSFYQHYRSKRQLLLVLMDELLESLSNLEFKPGAMTDVRSGLRLLLARAFQRDLRYLGVYRAWQEIVISDRDLARKQKKIRSWTTARVETVFQLLQQLPGARPEVDTAALARAMDSFFWSLLAEALLLRKVELNRRIDSATHLIYHALFVDSPQKRKSAKKKMRASRKQKLRTGPR